MSEDAVEQATKCVTMRPRDNDGSLVVVIIPGRTMKSLPSLIAECTRATFGVRIASRAAIRTAPSDRAIAFRRRVGERTTKEREKKKEEKKRERIVRESLLRKLRMRSPCFWVIRMIFRR